MIIVSRVYIAGSNTTDGHARSVSSSRIECLKPWRPLRLSSAWMRSFSILFSDRMLETDAVIVERELHFLSVSSSRIECLKQSERPRHRIGCCCFQYPLLG